MDKITSDNNIRKFYSNTGRILTGVLVIGILTGLILWLLYDLTGNFVTYMPLYIFDRIKVPACFITGFLTAVIIQILRFTVVSVTPETVCINRIFKKYKFELNKYYFFEQTDYERITISVAIFNKYKRYLILKDSDGKIIKIRLYNFSASALYGLIDEIHKLETESISEERKNEVIRDSWENERRFDIPAESIVKDEWKKVGAIIAVWIGAAAILSVLLCFTENDAYHTFELIIMTLASLACVIEIPFELIRTVKNAKRCPHFIEFKGEHLMIDDEHFIISDVKKLIMTSADRKSSSVYPVQRYMIIETEREKYKFWIGSEASMSEKNYKRICAFIRQAFINYPSKLVFKGKRSWLNT